MNGKKVENAAWMYKCPDYGYEEIRNQICCYPSNMDACYVNNEKVQAQAGDFYSGWITSEIVGPREKQVQQAGKVCQGVNLKRTEDARFLIPNESLRLKTNQKRLEITWRAFH